MVENIQARIFLKLMAKSYGMELTAVKNLTQTTFTAESKEATEIIKKIKTEFYDLLANLEESK